MVVLYIRNEEETGVGTRTLVKENSSFTITITEHAGMRLDKFLAHYFPLYSRSFFSRLIDDGHITINNEPVTKSGTKLRQGDVLIVAFPQPRTVQEKALEYKDAIEVIFEHPHFLILYKPAGLLVHPPSMASTAATVVDWLLINYTTIQGVGYVDRPGIVHRLDKDTSGLLIVPRTNHAHGVFGDLFRERTIDKTYLAVVHGHPDKAGTIDLEITRDPITRTKMTTQVNQPGCSKRRDAKTHYRILEYLNNAALVEVKPVTGRTHQIRVHFASIGHPLIGDPVYGKKSKLIKRQALHAYKLSFMFEGKPYEFTKEMPEDMHELIETLK